MNQEKREKGSKGGREKKGMEGQKEGIKLKRRREREERRKRRKKKVEREREGWEIKNSSICTHLGLCLFKIREPGREFTR